MVIFKVFKKKLSNSNFAMRVFFLCGDIFLLPQKQTKKS